MADCMRQTSADCRELCRTVPLRQSSVGHHLGDRRSYAILGGGALLILSERGGGMNPIRHETLAVFGVALLLWGFGEQPEATGVAQRPDSYPEARVLPPADQVAPRDSLARANRVVLYRNAKYGFHLRYDSSQVRISVWPTEKGVDFLQGPSRVARVRVIDDRGLRAYFSKDSLRVENLRETTVLPDTLLAAAILCTVNGSVAGEDDGLALPPTKISHDSNSHGTRFTKVWCDYAVRWHNKSTAHYSAGPFYLVDVSSPSRVTVVQIMYDWSRAAPEDVETFLDSLVSTIEIVR
jgi:hypothetical protein